ncbi:NADH-quinone oxidoreductase subunit J [Bacillus horti]|uniref:NADH-quinone oxidoreductase subunit J n=1 Tax=Caldalkalibacillus horti TaxID=77523 RepID=A0ABT9VZN1_9BACI|nr:NADH-quinone oxidoreductase subunit J [Bacillus horti]MDQ0166443.1 NADH-quinone oxidoreductase subunit J [Bacillus horti]
MSGEMIAFLVLAVLTLAGAILMINLTKVVHMVIALALTFLGIAGLFILLEAEFIAFAQVLIYGGAVAIIMLFGIMLTKHDDQDETRRVGHKIFAGLIVVGFFLISLKAIFSINWTPQNQSFVESNTAEIGVQLFAKYVIPFELVSVVLLVALIGAIILAKKDDPVVTKEGEKSD